jgi:hypothetical protein
MGRRCLSRRLRPGGERRGKHHHKAQGHQEPGAGHPPPHGRQPKAVSRAGQARPGGPGERAGARPPLTRLCRLLGLTRVAAGTPYPTGPGPDASTPLQAPGGHMRGSASSRPRLSNYTAARAGKPAGRSMEGPAIHSCNRYLHVNVTVATPFAGKAYSDLTSVTVICLLSESHFTFAFRRAISRAPSDSTSRR